MIKAYVLIQVEKGRPDKIEGATLSKRLAEIYRNKYDKTLNSGLDYPGTYRTYQEVSLLRMSDGIRW